MVWGSVISAVGGITGGLIGGYLNNQTAKSVAKNQYGYNTRLQDQNIAWQKEAMQNSHQWAVEDLKKAGLNPAIAANNGATTGGASASQGGQGTPTVDYASIFQNAVNSAVNIYNDSRKTDADIINTNANTAKAEADTASQILNNELVEKYGDKEKNAQIANTLQKTAEASAETAKKVEEINKIKGGRAAEIAGTATTAKLGKAIKDAEVKIKKEREKQEEQEEQEEQNYFKKLFNFKISKNNNWE